MSGGRNLAEGGDVTQVHDSTGFDRISIDSTGDKQFSVGESKVLEPVGADLDMKFETTLKDGDPATGLAHSYDVYQSLGNPAVKVAVEQGLDVT